MSSMKVRFSRVIGDRDFCDTLEPLQMQLTKFLAEGGLIPTLADELGVHRSTLDSMALNIFMNFRKAKQRQTDSQVPAVRTTATNDRSSVCEFTKMGDLTNGLYLAQR